MHWQCVIEMTQYRSEKSQRATLCTFLKVHIHYFARLVQTTVDPQSLPLPFTPCHSLTLTVNHLLSQCQNMLTKYHSYNQWPMPFQKLLYEPDSIWGILEDKKKMSPCKKKKKGVTESATALSQSLFIFFSYFVLYFNVFKCCLHGVVPKKHLSHTIPCIARVPCFQFIFQQNQRVHFRGFLYHKFGAFAHLAPNSRLFCVCQHPWFLSSRRYEERKGKKGMFR